MRAGAITKRDGRSGGQVWGWAALNEMADGLRGWSRLRGKNAELDAALRASLEELGRRAEELRASRGRIVAAHDAARRRIERDLHDGAQQQLVLAELKLSVLRDAIAADPEASALVDDVRRTLDRSLEELRDLAHGIYPALLAQDGLPAAVSDAAIRCPVPTEVRFDGVARYAPDVEAAVYFCSREALQNVTKHAGRNAAARVSLSRHGGCLRFEVRDDGDGFDPYAVRATGGLQNMCDRVGALGGTLAIDSVLGTGTRVNGSIPV